MVATNPNGQTPSAAATLTLLPVTPNAVAAIVARNPIAYWRLNETSGTVVHDSAGGLDGTFLPATTLNGFVGPTPTASPPSPAFLGLDAANTAFKFDGNTSDINCQSPNITVKGITITAFIKVEGLPNNNNGGACGVVFTRGTGILGLNLSGQDANGNGGNTLGYTWDNVFYDFGMAPISNAWTFVALVVNSEGATMYMDPDGTGLQSSVDSTTTNWPAQTIDAPIHLGTDPSGNRIYQGLLDEVAIFDHALTPADIQAIHDTIYQNTYSPIPPAFVVQPVSRTMFAGSSFTLTGEAEGSQPLTYQWTKNNVNITNAIRGSISFANASAADSGTYQLVVSQGATVVKSTPAVIQVVTPAPGTYAASVVAANPIAYWRLNETTGTTAIDSVGGHDGTVVDNVTLGASAPVPPLYPGFEAGNRCYGFDGIDSYVALPDNLFPYPVSGTGNSPFSFAAWFKTTAGGVILGQQTTVPPTAPGSYVPAVRVGTDGLLYVQMFWAGVSTGAPESTVPVNDGQFHHVAVTYDGASQVVYLDGVSVSTKSFSQTSYSTEYHYQLGTGYNGAWSGGGTAWFNLDGAIDEVAIYNRALTADEVLAFYSAASYGATTAPFVTLNPSSKTVIAGDSVSLRAAVMGSLPISYQWKKDGVSVPGATGATLSLTNAYLTDAGSYVLWATNGVGHTNTAAATLTVLPPPAYVNLTNNLVLHLKFDNNYNDSSPNANDASPNGSPTFVPDGQIGQAVHLSNLNYLMVPDPNSLLLFSDTDDFTVSFWTRYTNKFNDLPIIGNAVNSTYQLGWVFADENLKIEVLAGEHSQ